MCISAIKMDEEEKKKIKRLVEDLVCSTDLQLDHQKMKTLKSKCKTSDDFLSEVHQQLFRNLTKKNSEIRILCLDILDELFSRSHYFRTLVLESFDSITLLCVGVDSLNPLPLPAAAAKKLQSNAIRIIKGRNRFKTKIVILVNHLCAFLKVKSYQYGKRFFTILCGNQCPPSTWNLFTRQNGLNENSFISIFLYISCSKKHL